MRAWVSAHPGDDPSRGCRCDTLSHRIIIDGNNNTLYKTLPATLVYSSLFAEVVKNNPEIVDQVYDYRYFM